MLVSFQKVLKYLGLGKLIHYVDILKDSYEIYVVQPKDTLWSISREFGVSIDDMKQLNGLKTDEIDVNQIIKIKKK